LSSPNLDGGCFSFWLELSSMTLEVMRKLMAENRDDSARWFCGCSDCLTRFKGFQKEVSTRNNMEEPDDTQVSIRNTSTLQTCLPI